MHWFADLIAAIGVVLNGIPQGIMALSLGFAVFPTTFSFLLVCAINFIFNSVAPVSFQAESLALTGNLGRNTKEYTSIIFGGSIIMAIIGLTGTLTKIVGILGNHIITGMMAGVGIMLAKIALEMTQNNQKSFTGWVSIAIAVVTYLISNDLVWTICLSVIGSSLYAVFGEHYRNELPANVTMRRFIFTKPTFNPRMMLIMAVILFAGWLPKIGKYVPSASIAGFLLVLGMFVTFPENAATALAGKEQLVAAATMIITALVDPFVGLLSGGLLKVILPLLAAL